MSLEFFSNDRYKVLQCMFERQIEVRDKIIAPISQQDIADIVKLSKKKVNTIIRELKDNGYVLQQSSTRGKYLLTEKALQVVSHIQEERDGFNE